MFESLEKPARETSVKPTLSGIMAKLLCDKYGKDVELMVTNCVLLRLPPELGSICKPVLGKHCGRCGVSKSYLRSTILEFGGRY